MSEMKCPHCDKEIHFNAVAKQAIGARTGITFTPKEGHFLTAKAVSESITAYANLLDMAAEEIGSHKTVQMLEKIETADNGAITATFITALAD